VTGQIFSKRGRSRLEALPLPADQMRMALRHHDELARLAAELAVIDRDMARRALADPDVKRLMTIGGVDAIVAASVLAAIGDIRRFSSPEKLVSYLGLNPSVHQSGDHPAYHGHITHQGRGHARGMLVEAAWSIASSAGPLSAFFHRISIKRCKSVAAVATARKLAVLVWHMLTKQKDYVWMRPALLQFKMRRLELTAGYASRRGGNKPGPARDYSVKAIRDLERAKLAGAERDYRSFVANWREHPPTERKKTASQGGTS
tara:strand:+ start:115 stop:894 length:780 start_codon:yes stop_codon:yes gene_type:complete